MTSCLCLAASLSWACLSEVQNNSCKIIILNSSQSLVLRPLPEDFMAADVIRSSFNDALETDTLQGQAKLAKAMWTGLSTGELGDASLKISSRVIRAVLAPEVRKGPQGAGQTLLPMHVCMGTLCQSLSLTNLSPVTYHLNL